MTDKEVIKRLIASSGMTQDEVAKKAGLKGQGSLSAKLNRNKGSMRVDSFVALLDILGCELVARKKKNVLEEYLVDMEPADDTRWIHELDGSFRCPKCRRTVASESRFCPNCGHEFENYGK